MLTPPTNGEVSMIQRTAGWPRPYRRESSKILLTSGTRRLPRAGVKPMSCIRRRASPKVPASRTARRTNGTPRFVAWAMTPPATEPPSMATPSTAWPRPNTVSSSPVYPVCVRASTSHASMAPEKKVKPSPRNTEVTAQPQNGASIHHMSTYSSVDTISVSAPSRNDARRPRRSATMPVGTSNSIIPTVKNALAANASRLLRPASSRNSVLMPQMSEVDSVVSSSRVR